MALELHMEMGRPTYISYDKHVGEEKLLAGGLGGALEPSHVRYVVNYSAGSS